MTKIRIFEVGGCVRDDLLGRTPKDVDFVCEAPSFQAMLDHIEGMGLKLVPARIHPEHLTAKALVPKDHWLRERCKDADFVLARKDGPTKDGRRPEFVEPGTLLDDLARRDFTCNAIARCPITREVFDPHCGEWHIQTRTLRFVGDPEKRIREDGLRVLRAWRFHTTTPLNMDPQTKDAVSSALAAEMLSKVSEQRREEEVAKMLSVGTPRALEVFAMMPSFVREAIFTGRVRLSVTLKKAR